MPLTYVGFKAGVWKDFVANATEYFRKVMTYIRTILNWEKSYKIAGKIRRHIKVFHFPILLILF